jgi:hypothetical protein
LRLLRMFHYRRLLGILLVLFRMLCLLNAIERRSEKRFLESFRGWELQLLWGATRNINSLPLFSVHCLNSI